MRSFIMELARTGGRIARSHFRSSTLRVTNKGRSDYVSHVDRQVEDAISMRIRAHYPDHLIIGEEGAGSAEAAALDGPCWIIDPIDGTTNFLRGIASFAVSIAFCDAQAKPKVGVVYDPIADEMFIGERAAGLWLGHDRIYTAGTQRIEDALIATALPFRHLQPLEDGLATLGKLQQRCDDFRRSGSAALDLAYVACGRLDAYFELGIWSWDTAAGELLVRCGGGQATDFHGHTDQLLQRRSIVAAASPELHTALLPEMSALAQWLDQPPYRSQHAAAVVSGAD